MKTVDITTAPCEGGGNNTVCLIWCYCTSCGGERELPEDDEESAASNIIK